MFNFNKNPYLYFRPRVSDQRIITNWKTVLPTQGSFYSVISMASEL